MGNKVEAMRKFLTLWKTRCRSVVRDYIEDSESPGLKPNFVCSVLCQGLGSGGFADSPGAMASSFALRAASSATLA